MFENQSNAQNVLLGSGIQFFTGAVSTYDGIDYYKLQVNSQSSLNLSLYGLSADVNAYLFDNAAKLVASSTKTGVSSESINTTLDAGTYFVKVDSSLLKNSQGYINSSYQLAISNNSLFSNIDDKSLDGQMFHTGDFNGDGIQDVFRQERGNLVNGVKDAEFLIGKANGSFDAPVQVANSSLFQGNNNRLIFGDFNGDRKTDIIRQQYNGWSGANGAQFYSLSNGSFQLVANVADSDMMKGDATNLIAGDFNNDGFADLIRQEKGLLVDDNRDVELYTSNGTFGWNSRTVLTNSFTVDGNEALLVAGDFIAGGGKDLMRIEIENTIINGVNDIQYLSYQNSNMEAVSNTPKNIAPQAPLVYGVKASYDANSTLTLATNYAWDSNGWQDISKVDFWLTNALNQRVELADANSFISYNQNYAKFSYSTSLSGIAAGDYKLNAVAYDKAGAASNTFSQAMAIKAPANIAPQAPLVYGVKASYDANSTLTLATNYAWDSNGWQDISKVDFWLTNALNQRIELTDANSFISYNQNYAKFSYSTSLSGIAAGDYKLNAVAYDKSGAASNTFSQAMAIKAPANIAPQAPLVYGVKASYDANSTLTLATNYAWDSNGWQDISKVDFWLTNAQGGRVELADANSFISYNQNYAKFSYSTSLSGIAAGDYKLNAVAYDKAGAASNTFTQAMAIKALNIAPNAPVITGVKSSYEANSTLTIDSGSIADSNGWQDISKVQFWLTDAQGNKINTSDVTSFTANDTNSAKFSYSSSLSGLAAGNYTLNATAYDKAGLASNQFTQSFSIEVAKDWFESNLKDLGIVNLSRSKAADGILDRNDVLSILRDMEDGGVVDTYELADLKSLITTTTAFSMSDPVRYLSNKLVTDSYANISNTNFEASLGKWFLGTVAPTPTFTDESNGQITNFTYTRFQGSLFGTNTNAQIGGIDQRSFGDCVLLAALGATFAPQSNDAGNSISKTINDMLIDNGDNTYTVRFFTQDLKAEWVTVDNRLVTTNNGFWDTLFGASNENGLWAPIIEKACAQWREFNEGSNTYTGWDIIGNGDNLEAGLQRITGRATSTYYTGGGSWDFSFNLIKDSLSAGKAILSAGVPYTNGLNLISGHAYSVTNAYISATGEQRVVVRNPWGIDYGWDGAADGNNDGFVDLSYDQFRNFSYITIA